MAVHSVTHQSTCLFHSAFFETCFALFSGSRTGTFDTFDNGVQLKIHNKPDMFKQVHFH